MTDRHRADALGCNGDPAANTPHIDRLAGEGATIVEMHSQAPSRVAARASVLLERYVRDHGVGETSGTVPLGQPTFVHALQDEGYHTGCVGPMHFWVDEHDPAPLTPERLAQLHGYGFDDAHTAADVAARTARWIAAYDDDEPWFLWVSLPDSCDDGRTNRAGIALADEAVGRLRQALDDSSQLDNTWILYTSSHGSVAPEPTATSDAEFSDQVTRVPLIVRPAGGAPEAMTVTALTESMDLSATIRALGGATGRRHLEGRSLLPQLDGSGGEPARRVVFSEANGDVMARTARHKIVVHASSLAVRQLFDLEADPHENRNLAIEQPELAATLRAEHIQPFLERR